MGTSQIRINRSASPNLIDLLKRKRDEEVMSERLPNDVPVIAAASQPIIRTSDIAVTDSLPPAYNSQTGDLPDTDLRGMPPNVSLNAIRPRFANSATPPTITATSAQMPSPGQIQSAPINNKSLFDARSADSPVMPAPSINTNQVIGRNPFADTQPTTAPVAPNVSTIRPMQSATQPTLADKYLATAQPYDEPSNAPVSAAIRPRITQSIDPLQRAAENAAAPVLPDFGQDRQGNQRTHAKRGFGGRAIAFAKDLGLNMLEGRGLIASAADATHAAINPDILAERRAKMKTAENQQELATQLGIAGEQAKIGQIKAATDYTLQRPAIESDRQAEKQAYDQWRMRSGDAKLDNYSNYLKWKMENGDKRATTYADYVDFQKQTSGERLSEQQRHNRATEDIGRAGVGVRQAGVDVQRGSLQLRRDAQSGTSAKDYQNAQRLIDHSRTLRTRAASARTQEAADALNQQADDVDGDLRTQYGDLLEEAPKSPINVPGVGAASSGLPPRLKPGRAGGKPKSDPAGLYN